MIVPVPIQTAKLRYLDNGGGTKMARTFAIDVDHTGSNTVFTDQQENHLSRFLASRSVATQDATLEYMQILSYSSLSMASRYAISVGATPCRITASIVYPRFQ